MSLTPGFHDDQCHTAPICNAHYPEVIIGRVIEGRWTPSITDYFPVHIFNYRMLRFDPTLQENVIEYAYDRLIGMN